MRLVRSGDRADRRSGDNRGSSDRRRRGPRVRPVDDEDAPVWMVINLFAVPSSCALRARSDAPSKHFGENSSPDSDQGVGHAGTSPRSRGTARTAARVPQPNRSSCATRTTRTASRPRCAASGGRRATTASTARATTRSLARANSPRSERPPPRRAAGPKTRRAPAPFYKKHLALYAPKARRTTAAAATTRRGARRGVGSIIIISRTWYHKLAAGS